MNFYRQMQFLLFFFDVDNFSSSLNNLNHFYEEANTACNCDIKFAIIVYGDDIPNMNEIKKKFKCKIFEVNLNDIETNGYAKSKYFHPKTWNIECSNNHVNWTLIDNRVNDDKINGSHLQYVYKCQQIK